MSFSTGLRIQQDVATGYNPIFMWLIILHFTFQIQLNKLHYSLI